MKQFLILLVTLLFVVSCHKKNDSSGEARRPPGSAGGPDEIFNDGFEKSNAETENANSETEPLVEKLTVEKEEAPVKLLTGVERILQQEEAKAPLKNYLFDQIVNIDLNTDGVLPELTMHTYPATKMTFTNQGVEDGIFYYAVGIEDPKDRSRFLQSFSAELTFYSTDKSLVLIRLKDQTSQVSNAELVILRVQRQGSVLVDSSWFELNPNKPNQVVINETLQSKVNNSFVALLKDITYDPTVTLTQYHILKNPDDTNTELARSEKVEMKISNSFSFSTLDIKADKERLKDQVRLKPENLHWLPGFAKEKRSGEGSSWNPGNYFFRQPNVATESFYRDDSRKEFQTKLRVPGHDYKNLLKATTLFIDAPVKPNVHSKETFHPFQFQINFPEPQRQ